MIRSIVVTSGLCLGLAAYLPAQSSHSADMDALLEHLVGQWRMTGSVRGQPVVHTLDAAHVLQGRFVELHMEDVTRTTGV